MNSTIPTLTSVLKKLDPLIPVLYRALEAATQDTRTFFDSQNREIDPYLAPCLVRYFAKEHLRQMGQDAQYEQEDVYNLANNGLSLVYADYQLRILKADQGIPPVPGHSVRKQGFYSQQQAMLYLDSTKREPRPSAANLLILWEVGPKYALLGLSIACPKKGLTTKASVEAHWQESLPYPAPTAVATAVAGADDLPIWLKADEGDAHKAQ